MGDGGLRLESIPNAAAQAKAVVATLTDSPPPGTDVPRFWSTQYDCRLETVVVPYR